MLLGALGVIGDLLAAQRTCSQRTFERVRRIELQLGVPPSHYEPGAAPATQRPTAGGAASAAMPAPPASARHSAYDLAGDRRAVPTGNTFDKYGSTNPVVRSLMAGFERTLDELFERAARSSVLDVGCGEGVLSARWAERLADGRVVGVDLEDPKLAGRVGRRRAPNLEFRPMKAEQLEFADDEFDLVAATEVLEHVPDPSAARRDGPGRRAAPARVGAPRAGVARAQPGPRRLRRRAGQHARASQPLEPQLVSALLARFGEVVETRSPFPWTMLLVRVG